LQERAWIEKAIALDPHYAQAYSALAGNYSGGVLFGWSENRGEDLDHASQLAHKALAFLDDSNSYALAKLCEIHYLQSQYDRAVAECERVVATNPNSAEGYLELADALTAANSSWWRKVCWPRFWPT